jgi:hypothetical protein
MLSSARMTNETDLRRDRAAGALWIIVIAI